MVPTVAQVYNNVVLYSTIMSSMGALGRTFTSSLKAAKSPKRFTYILFQAKTYSKFRRKDGRKEGRKEGEDEGRKADGLFCISPNLIYNIAEINVKYY